MRRALVLLLFSCATDPDPIAPDAGTAEDAEPIDAEPIDAEPMDAEPIDIGEPPLGPVTIDLAADPPAALSAFNLLRVRDGAIEYNDGIFPYELNTALFSDYAIKRRAIYVPPGSKIQYRRDGAFEFPIGTAIIKSFLFDRIIETRLLIRHADGWRPYPYLWREDGSDADYFVRGKTIAIDLIDPLGNPRTAQYHMPQRNECLQCHQLEGDSGEQVVVVIGPKARHLNRDGQLEAMDALGLIEGLPTDTSTIPRAFDFDSLAITGTSALDAATLETAARDYLDINCAHCHNPRAINGVTSQFFLNYDNTDLFRLGFCKEPGSAGGGAGGLRFDIVPGDPRSSILWYRMQTEDVGDIMPLISRSLRDDVGVGVIYGWIANLPADDCL
jgi:uncharacterized repeat protein (TIGR03806 family)